VKRVLVTRPAPQAGELVELLAAYGIEGLSVPTVAILPSAGDGLRDRLAGLDTDAWLVVTSANGAAAVVAALETATPLPAGPRVAAVGPATAQVLRNGGLRVDYTPDEYLTLAVADGLGDVTGRRVLLARSDAATPDLRDALLGRGALVEEVVAYQTVEGPAESRGPLRRALEEPLDGIAFTSGSTVRGLLALLPRVLWRRATSISAYCIGPVTAQVARQAGFWVADVAPEHTAPGLARAIVAHLTEESP
jgi:uroporphyrinogen-III synthase